MKRLFLIISIVMASATIVQAQECDKQCDKHKDNAPSFAQKQTDDMVAMYNLNDNQAKQLLALNKEFAGKMGPMRHHQKTHHGLEKGKCGKSHECKKGEGHECKKGEGQECKKGQGQECKKGEGHECKKGEGHECKKGEGHECKKEGQGGKGHHGMKHGKAHMKSQMSKEQMKKIQSDYDAQLKKIMTSKQFKQYQKNKKAMK